MTADTAAALRIFKQLQTSRRRDRLKVARADYLATFGRPYDDKSIERDFLDLIERHFEFHRIWCAEDVAVPASLALAFLLRFIARRGSLPNWPAYIQMEALRARVAEYKNMGYPSGKAQAEAVKDVARTWRLRGEREPRLDEEQMLARLRDPDKYNLTPPRVRKKRPRTNAGPPESVHDLSSMPDLGSVPFKPSDGSEGS